MAQQFFFVSCSLQDMIRLLQMRGKTLDELHLYWAAQLNDTHPSIAAAELMRLLVDEHAMEWDQAWTITQKTCGYTNHTLLAEALERWPLPLFARLLPRHLEIIYEINRRFLDGLRLRYPGDDQLLRRLSLIDEAGDKHVRMAHLAGGSHAINGVAALHTNLLKQTVLRDFYRVAPEKFLNVTNGVTPRRWIALSNPKLSALITRHIGDQWIANLEELQHLEPLAFDVDFQRDWQTVKADNKRTLAGLLKERTGIIVDPHSLFDIQVKRPHEYKRQHLNVLYLVTLYNKLRRNYGAAGTPRTVIFGGKAAPGYRMAKLIIKLINAVALTINHDPVVSQVLKVVFLPDFNVKSSHRVYPAADLSEQISTAGKEASGTGNMKFAMNGALTIGTLDGANVEIRDAVGHENFFLFGLTAEEVEQRKAEGYTPRSVYVSNPELRETIDLINSGFFSSGDRALFQPVVEISPYPRRLHAPRRLSIVCGLPTACERRVCRLEQLDSHVDSQQRPKSADSLPIARSVSIAATSGRSSQSRPTRDEYDDVVAERGRQDRVRALLSAPPSTRAGSTSACFRSVRRWWNCFCSMMKTPRGPQGSSPSMPRSTAPITTGTSLCQISNPAKCMPIGRTGPSPRTVDVGSTPRRFSSIPMA